MIFLLLLLPPLLAALLAALVRPYHPVVGRINAGLSLLPLGATLACAALLINGHTAAIVWGLSGALGLADFLRVDSLSVLLLGCVSAVAVLTLFLGPGLGKETAYNAGQLRRYQVFVNLFVFAMLLAVSANNVGVMWIAVEATTIFSAMIIPLTLSKVSVEASWKYILICSVGIALAFAGTVLAYFDFVSLAGRLENALNWPVLLSIAPALHPEVMRLAFVFLLIGYGTKAGIAPMHTWLPDAHSEAPAPLSAMMSGVLLSVALYAMLRWKIVVDVALGGSRYTDRLLLVLGVLSLVIAAFSLVLSRNYKRMLAYSSIEHTGLLCISLALGPLGVFAAMLHLINHAAAKSMMFLLAGRILHRYHTTEIKGVSGLLKTMPLTGGLFAVGLLALVGLPPFGMFITEFAMIRAGFVAGQPWLMGLVLILLAVAFVSLINHLNRMLYGLPPAGVKPGEENVWALAPFVINVAVLITLGLILPAPLATLLNRIVEIVAR